MKTPRWRAVPAVSRNFHRVLCTSCRNFSSTEAFPLRPTSRFCTLEAPWLGKTQRRRSPPAHRAACGELQQGNMTRCVVHILGNHRCGHASLQDSTSMVSGELADLFCARSSFFNAVLHHSNERRLLSFSFLRASIANENSTGAELSTARGPLRTSSLPEPRSGT